MNEENVNPAGEERSPKEAEVAAVVDGSAAPVEEQVLPEVEIAVEPVAPVEEAAPEAAPE